MIITRACRSYFSAVQELYDYQENTSVENTRAAVAFLTYFTVVIPLAVGAVYGASSLYERVTGEASLTAQSRMIKIATKQWPTAKVSLNKVLATYKDKFKPLMNASHLQEYSISKDYRRHAKTARIYYNSRQLVGQDALRVVFQREPTNIAMGLNQYNPKALEKCFGYRKGVYNDPTAKKANGRSFRDLPNSVAVYSETYLWSSPGGRRRKEVAILSLAAPALDSPTQPNYSYYMSKGRLNVKRYENEESFLFRAIEMAVRENHKSAFGNKGIKRVVLSKFGLGAFIATLCSKDKVNALYAFKKQAALFQERIADLGLEVVLSSGDKQSALWKGKTTASDNILISARDQDLIINPWDPHSAPGNGNDGDHSFDGAIGSGSGVLLTQTSWLNPTLRNKKCLRAVKGAVKWAVK